MDDHLGTFVKYTALIELKTTTPMLYILMSSICPFSHISKTFKPTEDHNFICNVVLNLPRCYYPFILEKVSQQTKGDSQH